MNIDERDTLIQVNNTKKKKALLKIKAQEKIDNQNIRKKNIYMMEGIQKTYKKRKAPHWLFLKYKN